MGPATLDRLIACRIFFQHEYDSMVICQLKNCITRPQPKVVVYVFEYLSVKALEEIVQCHILCAEVVRHFRKYDVSRVTERFFHVLSLRRWCRKKLPLQYLKLFSHLILR